MIAKQLAEALVKCQGMVEGAKKGKKNDHFRSKYADLASVWEACSDALQENGLAVLQFPTQSPPGTVGLRTVVLHESGESIEDTFHMPLKDATNPQAAGSAITYARRYALMAALGICPEDDDGNAAAKAPKTESAITAVAPVDVDKLRALYEKDFATAAAAQSDKDMKVIYSMVRGSALPDADKTKLLTSMGKIIKDNLTKQS